jgi:hypothetical protein
MVMRAFDANATRSVRRATIVYSADDIRRNITLRLSDGLPCVLELGADIPITSGFTIPGGMLSFSVDGAQRFKFIVAGTVPFLFYAKGAATDNGCPIEIVNVEILVKGGSTLATTFLIEQFGDNAPTDDRRPMMSLKNMFIQAVDVGGITSVMEHSSFLDVLLRYAVVDADGMQCRNVTHFLGDTDFRNAYIGSRFDNISSSTTMSFGRGATGATLLSSSVLVMSGEIQISIGDLSLASFVSCNVDSYTGNAGFNTLLRMEAFPRTVGPNEVDLDNLGGGGGAPTNATYVTLSTDATLTQERVLTAGSGITIVDAGAGSTVTISASGGGATLTAATITVPFELQAQTATVVDAGATAASKVMVAWGNTANTDENQPPASNVTFSAVGGLGQVLITVSSNDRDNVGGTYKVLYILG